MKTYSMTPRSIPMDDSWDVIVAGGGPAGCAAATAAAREGAKTLLIEQTDSLGGMGTSALVPALKKKNLNRRDAETQRGFLTTDFTDKRKNQI